MAATFTPIIDVHDTYTPSAELPGTFDVFAKGGPALLEVPSSRKPYSELGKRQARAVTGGTTQSMPPQRSAAQPVINVSAPAVPNPYAPYPTSAPTSPARGTSGPKI